MKKLIFSFSFLSIVACSSPGGNKAINTAPVPTKVHHGEESHHDSNELKKNKAAHATLLSFKEAKLKWTAFKTPKKIGVSGTFDDIKIKGNHFNINPSTVNTNNPERDAKLVKFFFHQLATTSFKGEIGKIKGEHVEIQINGKSYSFSVEKEGSKTRLKGSIDIIKDLNGNKALKLINEACFDLHQGKTWSNVDIEITL